MKKHHITMSLLAMAYGIVTAQTSNFFTATPKADRTVPYALSDAGVSKPIIWGLDLAWLSEDNIKRGVMFMGGKENVDVVRSSFTPTAALVDNELATSELSTANRRINIIKRNLSPTVGVVLNCDHPSVHSYFSGTEKAVRWAQLIETTARLHAAQGFPIVTVSPFNEPDYTSTGQGTITDFGNIAAELKRRPYFENIRISGGNTLNDDQALSWYRTLKANLDEGNTHQLAGNFDNYAAFFQAVRADGKHASNDELHNTMEAMVGAEYGLQTGIWWGTAEYTRGQFVQASDGVRLGYAEHRPNWTAASVYRAPDGKVQAFGGTSERQAATTTYRFLSTERDVFYNGYGPTREYIMTLPGGTGYQNGQTNAEGVVNITWGDDIQPVIDGQYAVICKSNNRALRAPTTTGASAYLDAAIYANNTRQNWEVHPADIRIGEDFSYFTFSPLSNPAAAPDVLNWSLNAGTNIILYPNGTNDNGTVSIGKNHQWFLEYAGDGYFYIRSRHSGLCLELSGSNIKQETKDGAEAQLWRFVPIGIDIETDAPGAPVNLTATPQGASIRLDWDENTEEDLAGYNVYRLDEEETTYNTIARNVQGTAFVDNTAKAGKQYKYVIRAVDKALNRSPLSQDVDVQIMQNSALVAKYKFDTVTRDTTENLNHAATSGTVMYLDGKHSKAIVLNGSNTFVQLPANVAQHEAITIATWVYWRGNTQWQRIFDFGSGETENMFVTPRSGNNTLRFVVTHNGTEQQLNATSLSLRTWTHIAVTLEGGRARLYKNGELVASSDEFNVTVSDLNPILNYIGRSQYNSDPLFNGYIDDFRIYNYALPQEEVEEIMNAPTSIEEVPATLDNDAPIAIYDLQGRYYGNSIEGLPTGMYITKRSNEPAQKLIIK